MKTLFQLPKLIDRREQSSTTSVVFFDLCFVRVLDKLAKLPSEHKPNEIREFFALYFPLWFLWLHTSLYIMQYDSRDFLHQILYFIQMYGMLLLAGDVITCKQITYESTELCQRFVSIYICIRVFQGLLWLYASYSEKRTRYLTLGHAATCFLVGLLFACTGFLVAWGFILCWWLAILVELLMLVFTNIFHQKLNYQMDYHAFSQRITRLLIASMTIPLLGSIYDATLDSSSYFDDAVRRESFARMFHSLTSQFVTLFALIMMLSIKFLYDQVDRPGPSHALARTKSLWYRVAWIILNIPLTGLVLLMFNSIRDCTALGTLSQAGQWAICSELAAIIVLISLIQITHREKRSDRYVLVTRRFRVLCHFLVAIFQSCIPLFKISDVKAFLGVTASPIFVLSLFEIFITHKQLDYISRDLQEKSDPNRRNNKELEPMLDLQESKQNSKNQGSSNSIELKSQSHAWPPRIGEDYERANDDAESEVDIVSSYNSYSDYIHDDYLSESESAVAFESHDPEPEDEHEESI